MKKTISLLIIFFFLLSSFVPGLIVAEEFETRMMEREEEEEEKGEETKEEEKPIEEKEETKLAKPVVRALWAMNGAVSDLSGEDDDRDTGAQILPSGEYQVNKTVSLCSIVSDQNGKEDIRKVFSEIYYPSVGSGEEGIGCGEKKGECIMSVLNKKDGMDLFCSSIQQSNSNLPVFYDSYGFSGICGSSGALEKETAAVYCCQTELFYNDVSGDYKISISAEDKEGLESNNLQGFLTYLGITAYEVDFTFLDYGQVITNDKKAIEGNKEWSNAKEDSGPTIRNIGNTNLHIELKQDDMGLGKKDGEWNIRYEARMGENYPFQSYWPEERVLLEKILGLTEISRLDFTIEVFHFPENEKRSHTGKLNINAKEAEYFACD